MSKLPAKLGFNWQVREKRDVLCLQPNCRNGDVMTHQQGLDRAKNIS